MDNGELEYIRSRYPIYFEVNVVIHLTEIDSLSLLIIIVL